jgi:hypothetical protein
MPQLIDLESLKIESTDSFEDVLCGLSCKILVGRFRAIPTKPPLPPETIERIRNDREADGTDPEADIRVAARPEDIMLVVVGGAGIKSAYIPTWGGTTQAVTWVIDLP